MSFLRHEASPPPRRRCLQTPSPLPAATASERPSDRYVVRLAGEVDVNELGDAIGLDGVTWLKELGLATDPPPPSLTL
jgi:hypothetical protein